MTIPTHDMEGGDRCPSGFTLDQIHLNELPANEVAHVDAHVKACAHCTHELQVRSAGFAAFEGLDSLGCEARLAEQLAGVTFPAALAAARVSDVGDCPSALTLEKRHLGDLADEAAAELDTHLVGCTACQETVAAFTATDGLPYDEEGVTGALHVALAGHEMPEKLRVSVMASEVESTAQQPGLLSKMLAFLRIPESFAPALSFGVLALAAVGVLAVVDSDRPEIGKGLQVKGALALQVYRKTPGGSEELLSGAAVRPGDHLRFALRAPHGAHVLLVGSDLRGFYPLYPADARTSVPFKSQGRFKLPGAVQLDDQPGSEWFHAVACKQSFGLGDIKAGKAPGVLIIPEACLADSIRMEKKAPER